VGQIKYKSLVRILSSTLTSDVVATIYYYVLFFYFYQQTSLNFGHITCLFYYLTGLCANR
jgi:hypothetical protein